MSTPTHEELTAEELAGIPDGDELDSVDEESNLDADSFNEAEANYEEEH